VLLNRLLAAASFDRFGRRNHPSSLPQLEAWWRIVSRPNLSAQVCNREGWAADPKNSFGFPLSVWAESKVEYFAPSVHRHKNWREVGNLTTDGKETMQEPGRITCLGLYRKHGHSSHESGTSSGARFPLVAPIRVILRSIPAPAPSSALTKVIFARH
jgi:hypothetical protein